MFVIKSKLLSLTKDYPVSQFQRAIAISQSFSGPSSHVLLLSDGSN